MAMMLFKDQSMLGYTTIHHTKHTYYLFFCDRTTSAFCMFVNLARVWWRGWDVVTRLRCSDAGFVIGYVTATQNHLTLATGISFDAQICASLISGYDMIELERIWR
jgi:hypothetical protein